MSFRSIVYLNLNHIYGSKQSRGEPEEAEEESSEDQEASRYQAGREGRSEAGSLA